MLGNRKRAVGFPAYTDKRSSRSNARLSISAVTLDSVYFQLSSETTTSASFAAFLQKLIQSRLLPSLPEESHVKQVIVLDNASVHRKDTVVEMVAAVGEGRVQLLFLPPYSPFLNPMEECFSKWKELVRQSEFQPGKGSLAEAITECAGHISQENVRKWITHTKMFWTLTAGRHPVGTETSPSQFRRIQAPHM